VEGEISQGNRIEKSLECFGKALEFFEQVDDLRDRQLQKAITELGITTSLEQLGTGDERVGNIRLAKNRLLEVMGIFEKLGASHYVTDTKNGLASKCIHLGEWEEAISWAEDAMRDWEETGFQQGISLMLSYCLKACHRMLQERPELKPLWAIKETIWLNRLKRMRENCLEGVIGKLIDESLEPYL
jgi:tetratricopeptide (TPR) repeat protein